MDGRRRCERSGDLNLVARRYNLRIDEKQKQALLPVELERDAPNHIEAVEPK
jgi:hypothetical protein